MLRVASGDRSSSGRRRRAGACPGRSRPRPATAAPGWPAGPGPASRGDCRRRRGGCLLAPPLRGRRERRVSQAAVRPQAAGLPGPPNASGHGLGVGSGRGVTGRRARAASCGRATRHRRRVRSPGLRRQYSHGGREASAVRAGPPAVSGPVSARRPVAAAAAGAVRRADRSARGPVAAVARSCPGRAAAAPRGRRPSVEPAAAASRPLPRARSRRTAARGSPSCRRTTDWRSDTLIACLTASLLTTNRPSCSLFAEVELGRAGQPPVDVGELVLAEPEAAVLDLRDQAGAHAVRPDLDPGVRRGEHRGVLNELGDEVDDVVDRVPRDQVAVTR